MMHLSARTQLAIIGASCLGAALVWLVLLLWPVSQRLSR